MMKIPFCRFDGKEFLTKLRGKQIMFVGDSVSMNQWQSLICLLHSSVPQIQILDQLDETVYNYTFPVSDIYLHKQTLFHNCGNFFPPFLPNIWSNHIYNAVAGIQSFIVCFSFHSLGWHWSGKNWSSSEAWFHQEWWKHMEKHGHSGFQHLALVVSQRTQATVRSLQSRLIFANTDSAYTFHKKNSLK